MLSPFGKEIRKVRLDKSLILKDMAERLNVSPAFLSAVETGRKTIPADFIARIAEAFSLAPDVRSRLESAAALSVKEFRIQVGRNASDDARAVAAMLSRKFPTLTDDVASDIKKILERTRG